MSNFVKGAKIRRNSRTSVPRKVRYIHKHNRIAQPLMSLLQTLLRHGKTLLVLLFVTPLLYTSCIIFYIFFKSFPRLSDRFHLLQFHNRLLFIGFRFSSTISFITRSAHSSACANHPCKPTRSGICILSSIFVCIFSSLYMPSVK